MDNIYNQLGGMFSSLACGKHINRLYCLMQNNLWMFECGELTIKRHTHPGKFMKQTKIYS